MTHYPRAKLTHLDIPNIHAVRDSYDSLRNLCLSSESSKWYSSLENTQWLGNLSLIIKVGGVSEKGVFVGGVWGQTCSRTIEYFILQLVLVSLLFNNSDDDDDDDDDDDYDDDDYDDDVCSNLNHKLGSMLLLFIYYKGIFYYYYYF